MRVNRLRETVGSVTRVVEYLKWSQQGEPGEAGLPKATFPELVRVAVARGMGVMGEGLEQESRVSHMLTNNNHILFAASSKTAQWSIQSGISGFRE